MNTAAVRRFWIEADFFRISKKKFRCSWVEWLQLERRLCDTKGPIPEGKGHAASMDAGGPEAREMREHILIAALGGGGGGDGIRTRKR